MSRHAPRGRESHASQASVRAAMLQRRAQLLCAGAWDVNVALLLAEDAEALAGNCRTLGRTDIAVRLERFAETLWAVLDPPCLPNAEEMSAITAAISDLPADGSVPLAVAPAAAEVRQTLFGYAADDDHGFPLLVRPPERYWQVFGLGPAPAPILVEIAPAPAPAPPQFNPLISNAFSIETEGDDADDAEVDSGLISHIPTAPLAISDPLLPEPVEFEVPESIPTAPSLPPIEAETPSTDLVANIAPLSAALHAGLTEMGAQVASIDSAGPAHARAAHLNDGSPLASDIDLQLRAAGFDLDRLRSVDDLILMLDSATPNVIVVGAPYRHAIERIGVAVKSARARSKHRILLFALANEAIEMADRLAAMRAGCDACLVRPNGAEEILRRARELRDNDQVDPYRIMVVEDDRSQAVFAESILRKNGMEAIVVTEAAAVLDELDRFRPDLILMDLNMPVCNGIELTALIREREAYISTPIVFLSGEGDTEKHFEALSVGGDEFLSKPIAPRHLISAVSSRCKRARQISQRRPQAAPAEPHKGLLESAQLSRRLTELLAMEDAASRHGGLMLLELASPETLARELGQGGARDFLQRLTDLLTRELGANDMLARCGDYGFLLLNPDRDTAGLEQFALRLRERAASREMISQSGLMPPTPLAIGICPFAAAAGDAKAMIDAAELAMRRARSNRGKGVEVCAAEAPGRADNDIVEAIRQALTYSRFHVVYQPIVSLRGEEERQFQALLRLPDASGRVYSASELIPAAEEAGLIVEIDRWMIKRCLATIAEHQRTGRELRLFVNQSLASVLRADRIEWMREVLATERLTPALLSLELRMASVTANLSSHVAYCLGMKQLGISLTLAGLEAGEAGTELLRHLPVDYVKLSSRYTRGDESLRGELVALVKAAHATGRKVIAPRVEEARVAAALWSSGIDLIQGNFVRQATNETAFDFQLGDN